MQKRIAPEDVRFSTMLLGLLSPLSTALALGLYALPGLDFVFPGWFWILLLFSLPLLGGFTQYTSRRVVHVRGYTALMSAIQTLLYGGLVWYALTKSMSWSAMLAFGILVGGILLTIATQFYLVTLRAPERAFMPHDDTFGILDETTGLVDPRHTPLPARQRRAKLDKAKLLSRASLPVVAALSMWLVRVVPAGGDIVLATLCASFFAVVFAMATGQNSAFSVASRRWEVQHDKPILIKR